MFRYSVDIPEFGKVTVKIKLDRTTENRFIEYCNTYNHLKRFQIKDRKFPLIGIMSFNKKVKEGYDRMFLYELKALANQIEFFQYVTIV